jgi:hypothetical protein
MTKYAEIPIGELFQPMCGSAQFIRRYIEQNPGDYPVYSGSLFRPFGHVNVHEFDGEYLSWTMNGYAGHVSEIRGKFSLTRDRGVFIPREGVVIPDLTYLRLAMEPSLKAAAVGRRIDGKRNTYTKIYPEAAAQVIIRLPVDGRGRMNYKLMSALGARYRQIELAKSRVKALLDAMRRSVVVMESPPAPARTLSLGGDWMEYINTKTGWTKTTYGNLDTGNREDTPVFSAARGAVAYVKCKHANKIHASPEHPVISFGANGDGSAGTNFVFHEKPFYVSNDRTCIRLLDNNIEPRYVYYCLRGMKERYGFGHTLKANAQNLSDVTIEVPFANGEFDSKKQLEMVETVRQADMAKRRAEEQLGRICAAQLNFIDQ